MIGRRSTPVGLVLLLMCSAVPPAAGTSWLHHGNYYDFAASVALDGAGNVVAALPDALGNYYTFSVEKIAGATGAQIWRADIPGGDPFGPNLANTVIATGGGDVVAAGRLDDADMASYSLFAVLKLAGATGAELWRYQIAGGAFDGDARAVAEFPGGDVVAVGTVYRPDPKFAVARLAGATGAELWRREIDGTGPGFGDQALAVAVDGAGNVVVVGGLENTTAEDMVVMKLAGATGADVWRKDIDGGDGAGDIGYALDVAPGGDVVVAGQTTTDGALQYTVIRFAGATGAELWRYAVTGAASGSGGANDVRFDAAGDVVAAGSLFGPTADFTVTKHAGATGAELWRYRNDGPGQSTFVGSVNALTIDGDDNVLAGGTVYGTVGGAFDPIVAKLDGDSGAEIWRQDLGTSTVGNAVLAHPSGDTIVAAGYVARLSALDGGEGPVDGKFLRVVDRTGNPNADRIDAQLYYRSLVTSPPGSVGDPTIGGGTVKLVNPTTAESAVFSLPSGSWKGLGSPAGSAGYLYVDGSGANGPCRRVKVRPKKQLRVSCSGRLGPIPFTLDELSQGALTISVQLGTADAQCNTFTGVYIVDQDEGGPDGGVFRAGRTRPVPGLCP